MAVPFAALQEINPGALIELFELELNVAQHGVADVYRFHAGISLQTGGALLAEDSTLLLYENGDTISQETGGLVWNGNTYSWFPIQAEGFEMSGNGTLPRPTLTMSNLFGTITGLILSLPRGIEGAKVTRIRTLARYLDADNFPGGVSPYSPDPTAEFPRQVFYIDRTALENRDVGQFELASVFDLSGVRAPKRECVSTYCPWVYRDPETCQYNGTQYFDVDDNPVATLAEDVCGKRLSSCERRFGQITRIGSITSGSNQLVLVDGTSVAAGLPVKGFGVPSGATVSSVSGNIVTMSANATATSVVSTTATLSTGRTTLTVASAAGLAVGMIVTGPNIQNGTTIAEISGTTVTLSQPVPWLNIATLITTKSSSYLKVQEFGYASNPRDPDPTSRMIVVPNRTNIVSGLYVIGPTIAEADAARVGSIISNSSGLTRLYVSFEGKVNGSEGTYSFYEVQAQPSTLYTFTTPDRNYVFRTDGILNFGGFPGVSTYLA